MPNQEKKKKKSPRRTPTCINICVPVLCPPPPPQHPPHSTHKHTKITFCIWTAKGKHIHNFVLRLYGSIVTAQRRTGPAATHMAARCQREVLIYSGRSGGCSAPRAVSHTLAHTCSQPHTHTRKLNQSSSQLRFASELLLCPVIGEKSQLPPASSRSSSSSGGFFTSSVLAEL